MYHVGNVFFCVCGCKAVVANSNFPLIVARICFQRHFKHLVKASKFLLILAMFAGLSAQTNLSYVLVFKDSQQRLAPFVGNL